MKIKIERDIIVRIFFKAPRFTFLQILFVFLAEGLRQILSGWKKIPDNAFRHQLDAGDADYDADVEQPETKGVQICTAYEEAEDIDREEEIVGIETVSAQSGAEGDGSRGLEICRIVTRC